MGCMVQPLRPPPSQPRFSRRIGVVFVAGLMGTMALLAGNLEGLGTGTDTTTLTVGSLLAPLRPVHNADPAVISPTRP